MDQTEPARRGRPPINRSEIEPVAAGVTAFTDATGADDPTDFTPTKRRRRASVGGHALKLAAPPKAGHTRRWFNDDNNRIATAHELGYDHVTERGIKTDDPSSRISRLVGTKANGEPLRAYLMETPDELYAEGVTEKEAHISKTDEAIAAGVPTDGQIGPASETYGRGSIQRD